ncbi:MAG: toxic anion resistance protein [Ruminococcus sp.]|jgi:uncharacterized protein YaaN involved in tellurite resistance|nr:toxic anion resistance protein [Ruminococcus sp.]
MGLQFTPSSEMGEQGEAVTSINPDSVVAVVDEPVQTFDMVKTAEQIKNDLVKQQQVQKLVDSVNINDVNSIVKFGSEAATEISKASDQVLQSMSLSQINNSGTLLQDLSEIMDQFDAKELTDEGKRGFLASLKKKVEGLLAKYQHMGVAVDRIYVQLTKYEKEIQEANSKLETMFRANIGFYKELTLYILAGEQACGELDKYIEDYRKKLAETPDSGAVAMDLQTLEQTRSIFEQRVMDLRIAENVAMQTIPMLKAMQFSNLNLIRKIDSAFIITLPVFKQALAQAVMLKRQRIQAESMSALDEKTNELLLKNAQNTVLQTKYTSQLASGSSIKVETLEQTWQTIVQGIEETQQIQEAARLKRVEDTKRLESLKEEYKVKINALQTKTSPMLVQK